MTKTMTKAFWSGLLLGVTLAVSPGCGPSTCSASTCGGCCDAAGACRPGKTADACGTSGAMCATCGAGQSCGLGVCGGATGGGSGGAAGGGSGGATGGGAGGSTGGGSGGSATGGSAGGGAGEVVFNEVCARGVDYLELINAGTSTQNLAGYSVADSVDDAGVPKLDSALVFPAGTTLSPGQYLLVVLNQADAGVTTSCLDGGVASCFGATFKVSNSRGETVWLLTPAGGVSAQADYPANAVAAGLSYGRYPDGTGAFAPTQRTPGSANRP